ncbi:hypothetical protein E2C01_072707 [Portunus trituberculatus]|uniref:Uncharacterized protein n=1 Tax=Portunus trituberculatus TaxID=210409 RepID=A0A5B7IC43_PORTR|nr:hypothetical protein [Portunus trituberculatus]
MTCRNSLRERRPPVRARSSSERVRWTSFVQYLRGRHKVCYFRRHFHILKQKQRCNTVRLQGGSISADEIAGLAQVSYDPGLFQFIHLFTKDKKTIVSRDGYMACFSVLHFRQV